ncbi:hypothetical protein MKZ38_000651 [Zalerion maritima]|uniref:Uncharacterized protein n=1 Tax=Zalerion maritima TaxID=339359 RepID=A0AAD5RFS5_9PEZI|nr:hypothetical protein MKZ38_000651 [Zalerion maritima]
MVSFMEELWESVLTPGPSPILLKATNATFAVTIPLLIFLAIWDKNIHYWFLSLISTGLWLSINWFVKEDRIAQQKLDKEKAEATAAANAKTSDDSDTEMEPAAHPPPTGEVAGETTAPTGESSLVEPVEKHGDLKARAVSSSARSGVSTEDEWEKVSEGEQPKEL